MEFYDGVMSFVKIPSDLHAKSIVLLQKEELNSEDMEFIKTARIECRSVESACYWNEINLEESEILMLDGFYKIYQYLESLNPKNLEEALELLLFRQNKLQHDNDADLKSMISSARDEMNNLGSEAPEI